MTKRIKHPSNIPPIKPERAWDEHDTELALRGYLTDEEVARRTGRSVQSVKLKRYYLANLDEARTDKRDRFRRYQEITKHTAHRRGAWTQDEHDILIEMRRDGYTALSIAIYLGRTYSAVTKYSTNHIDQGASS